VKPLDEMLRNLARPGATEFAIVSERLPCVKVNGAFQPVDEDAPSTDVILEMLVGGGGSRYVDALGAKPAQWSARLEGLGTVGVSAMMRDGIVQARFILQKREEAPPARGPGDFVPAPVGAVRPPPRAVAPKEEPIRAAGGLRFDAQARGAVAGEMSLELDDRGPVAVAPATSAREVELDLDAPPIREAPKLAPAVPPPTRREPTAGPVILPTPVPATRVAGAASVRELGELLMTARGAGASDLHILAARPPLVRVAGELTPRGAPLDAAFLERVVHSIVPPRLLAALESEGTCDFAVADAGGRCRVNVTRQRTGYKVCIRLVPPVIPTLASLGLPDAIATATHHHQGLILVTGPTGHGKTSTLAAIVDRINTETTHHVITVEDPVEYLHPRKKAMMSQREVGTHTKSFASALKGSLREDPDVIVVGELRDTETVRMALAASETGHLVIGTMNTPSAAKTIDRLIDLFPPSDQAQVRMTLAGGLRLVVSQRLVPNVDRSGLVAAVEILPGSISLWSLIRENKTYQIPSLQQRGKALGIVRLDDSLGDLVKSGKTTLENARAFAESPDELGASIAASRTPARGPESAKPEPMGGIIGRAGSLFRKGGS
jgi:twitching motility protein PilT